MLNKKIISSFEALTLIFSIIAFTSLVAPTVSAESAFEDFDEEAVLLTDFADFSGASDSIGCCYDEDQGFCSSVSERNSCEAEENSIWHEGKPFCDLTGGICEQGCCSIGHRNIFTTERHCVKQSELQGIESEFDRSITSESVCIGLDSENNLGACVTRIGAENTCVFTSGVECVSIGGEFAEGALCSNEELDTEESAGRIPGRYGDWRGATTKWDVYHPSLYDYRKEGELKRWVGRCLNINSRHSNISAEEIRNAFELAETGKDVLLSYTNHDFRNMINETEELVATIQKVAGEFSDVKFKWANAVEAFRGALDMKEIDLPDFDVEINDQFIRLKLLTGDVWGVQPFLALKTHSGEYFHDNFIIDGNHTWTYAFDDDSLNMNAVSDIGFACNDKVGNTSVTRINLSTRVIEKKYHNTNDWLTNKKNH